MQGASDDALLREYHALRTALWRFLHHSGPRNSATMGALVRVDLAIGIATTVALRGFHRGELPAGTSWESDLRQQVAAVSRHLADQLQAGGRS
jgi:hypothetical protein